MKLIFDCGSTKTSVALLMPDCPARYVDLTNGYNAISGGDDELYALIAANDAIMAVRDSIREIHFYGAGCATTQACSRVESQLRRHFKNASANVSNISV